MAASRKYKATVTLTPTHLQAIGLVAAEWSELEFALMMALAAMLNTTPLPACALGSLLNSINSKTDVLIRLAAILDTWIPLANEIEQICKEICSLGEERNAIVHSSWNVNLAVDAQGKARIVQLPLAVGTGFNKGGKKTLKYARFTAPEMRDVARASIEAREALLHLVWRKRPPLPDTPTLRLVLERQTRGKGQAPLRQPKPSRA